MKGSRTIISRNLARQYPVLQFLGEKGMETRVSLRDDDIVSAYFDFTRLLTVDRTRYISDTIAAVTAIEIGEFVSIQKWLGLPVSDPIVVDGKTGRIWIESRKHEGVGAFLIFLNSGPDAFDNCVAEMRRIGAIGEARRDIGPEDYWRLASRIRELDSAIFGFETSRSFWAETLEYLRGASSQGY